MPTRVHLPDGRIVNFPDSMTSDQIQAAMVKLSGGPPRAAAPSRTWGDTAADVGIGVAKGLGNTVVGLGEMVHMMPGVSRAVDALYGRPVSDQGFTEARQAVAPTNTPQRIGFGAEQIAEFFLPTGMAGKAAQVGKSGLLTLAQTGSPVTAGVSAGLTSVLLGAGAAQRASQSLHDSAQKSMVQALGPTKEAMKQTAKRIAPQMRQRGVGGSRRAMLDRATEQTAAVGAKIGAEIQAAAKAGTTISGNAIRSVLNQSKGGLMVEDATGALIPIEGTQRVLRKLDKLDQFVARLGPDIPLDKAAKIKTTYDRIVSRAGLYGQKAGASATDSADAWAVREATGAFRDLIAKGSATLDDLNAEYAFWKGLKQVLTETVDRTQAQGGGLVSGATGGAGLIAGLATGEGAGDKAEKALMYGVAGRQLVRAMQSPQWRTQVSAPMKEVLAKALASGRAEAINAAVSRIVSAMPAQFRPAVPR